jgi:hypothetical protein
MTEDEWAEYVYQLLIQERKVFFTLLNDPNHCELLKRLRRERNDNGEFRRFMVNCRAQWVRLEKRRPGQKHWLFAGCLKPVDVLKICIKQKGLCFWCLKPLNSKFHMDHYEPLFTSFDNSPENIRLTCPVCNLQKSRRNPEVFAERMSHAKPQS